MTYFLSRLNTNAFIPWEQDNQRYDLFLCGFCTTTPRRRFCLKPKMGEGNCPHENWVPNYETDDERANLETDSNGSESLGTERQTLQG